MRAHLALDQSSRTTDQDGHLHIGTSVLTGVGVQGYRGSEIPDSDKLGLDPFRIYNLLRPADELKRAASTLARKPILMRHIAISATDHPAEDVCGAVGSDVVFDGNVVRSSLTFWTGDAIDAVESGAMRDVSCGYWFKADMTPGTYQGTRYDGVMGDLAFNHLAIVVDGRVPGAMVGDSAIRTMAMDEDEDDDGIPEVTAPDDLSALCTWLADRLSPEDMTDANILIENLVNSFGSPSDIAKDSKYRGLTMNTLSTREIMREVAALDRARSEVRAYTGDAALAMDSVTASDVYCDALLAMGHDSKAVRDIRRFHDTATSKTTFDALKGYRPKRPQAMDATATASYNERFPNAGRLLKRGY